MIVRRMNAFPELTMPISPITPMLDQMLATLSRDDSRLNSTRGFPALNVWEDEKAIHVEAELPGIDPDKIDLKVHGDVLTLSGTKEDVREEKGKNFHHSERVFGSFCRQVTLPEIVDPEKVQAEYKNGLLNIRLNKKPEATARKIPVVSKN